MESKKSIDNQNYLSIKKHNIVFILIILLFTFTNTVMGQSVVMAWGNYNGIRIEGQLMEFGTSVRIVETGWTNIRSTGKEKQRSNYDREGDTQTITFEIDGIAFTEIVKENGKGSSIISLEAEALKDTLLEGVFFTFSLPQKYYSNASIVIGSNKNNVSNLLNTKKGTITTKKLFLEGVKRGLDIRFDKKTSIFLRKESESSDYLVYVKLMDKSIKKGQKINQQFTITATGEINNDPVEINIDVKKPGNKFAGFGGNFRLQKPETDPLVIQYCLDNMRLAWGRVEMPWQFWHPVEAKNPTEEAKNGNLHNHVHHSMEMAQRLAKLGMPVIVSAWQAPRWAIEGDPRDAFRYRDQGIYGYPLKADKQEKIYQSLGDYLEYLKNNYGVEAAMFSFNESDLGINIRHTSKEHAEFIKGFGEHLAKRGLATKLLLGDNSDANTYDFILTGMNDQEAHKYIGAVSFHSWRGCTDEMLKKWSNAAKKLNVPLIVGEGSTDAAAWRYPEIFYEQSFALYEINLYTRILAICEPLSILQWQLTADYSPLLGEGIYGTEGSLRPSQRFWNLKQLASTPEEAFALPVECKDDELNCAALGNIARGEYVIHIVNNGAQRNATITGLPEEITKLEVYVTDKERGMEKVEEIAVNNGIAVVKLAPAAYISLFSK